MLHRLLALLIVVGVVGITPVAYAATGLDDFVCETTTTAGTGTVDLDGALSGGYIGFIAAPNINSGDTVKYRITTGSGASKKIEAGSGVITDATPDTLTRDASQTTDDQSAPITELTLAGTSTVCLNWGRDVVIGDKGDVTIGDGFQDIQLDAGVVGTNEAAALDTGDITTGTFADARVDGSLEADEVNPTLGTQTQGNYVAEVADGTGIDGTASAEGATYTPTLDLTEISSGTWGNGAFTTFTFNASAGLDPSLTFADESTELANSDFFVSTDNSDSTNPRVFGMSDLSDTEYARWQFGDLETAIQSGFGQMMQIYAWHGIQIGGGLAGNNPAFVGGAGDADYTVMFLGDGTPAPTVGIDDQGELRWLEEDTNGSNYVSFASPASVTANRTCVFEDDANPIPDSCVGDGSDADTNTLGPDGDKGDITVGGTGTTLQIDTDAVGSAEIAAGAVGSSEAAALDAGDITTGTMAEARLPSTIIGLVSVQVLTSGSGATYTPTSGSIFWKVTCVGGGGGGGGSDNNDTSANNAGGGGSGGGTSVAWMNAAEMGANAVYTVGAGGTAGANTGGTGGTGTSTTFNPAGTHATLTCNGGLGGVGSATGADGWNIGGAPGTTPTGGDFNVAGGAGGNGIAATASGSAFGGTGGSSTLGGGGVAPGTQTAGCTNGGDGVDGTGGGGSGAKCRDTLAGATGGVGGDGVIIVEEYGSIP